MADIADQANDQLERMLEGWRAEIAHTMRNQVAAAGYCLNCEEKLDDGRRWCSTECCADWQLRQKAQQRNRRA